MKKSILTNCLKIAKDELEGHPQYNCFPHWTFIIKNNQIIGKGYNKKHEPNKCFGYHKVEEESFRPKWHSELDAIFNCKRYLEGCEIVNIRLNKLKETRIAMPCKTCFKILCSNNVKRIYFTTNECGWGKL